ncbi:hypothetical protein ILYODFUR_025293 [Ilyodon furcidens]|uniref:Uncharacterized protein n=1 Tax=Ilyodon furcidens TaxID=33524 RepID=A0ABV0VGZ7_9TELE
MLPSVALAPCRAPVGSRVGGAGEHVLCLFLCVIVTVCACFCVRLGLGLLPFLDQYFLPATLPAGSWCLCPLVYLWFSVSGAGSFGVLAHSRWLLAGTWTIRLCRASTWGVICPGVLGLWVHGWICSGVDGFWRGLWARRCIYIYFTLNFVEGAMYDGFLHYVT